MRFCFIIPDLAAGGAERVTITIARILEKHGASVEFLNLGAPEGEMRSWIEPEFKLTSFGSPRVLGAIGKLVDFMRCNADATFFSSREHVNLVGCFSAMRTHRKIIVRVPNMPNNKLTGGISGLKMRVIKMLNKYLLPKAEAVIAQNEEMRRQLIKFYSSDPDKVITINNPVDKEFVVKSASQGTSPFSKDETNFLAVCNVAYSKGIDVLMKAWPAVKAAVPAARMYVVGRNTSEYAQNLLKEASSLNGFTFLGFCSNPYPLVKDCDVFVLPSRMEGFPNVVLEAMALDRPVVATKCVDVIAQLITPGRNGYTCDIEDSAELSDCMLKALGIGEIKNTYNLFDDNALLNVFGIL